MKTVPGLMKFMQGLRFKTKILLSNMILILFITATIGGIAIYASTLYIERNTRDLSAEVIHQISENIDNRAKELFNSTVYFLSDNLIRQILADRVETVTNDNYPVIRARMEFLLAQYGNSNPYINSIIIKSRSGFVYWWERNKVIGGDLGTDEVKRISSSAEEYLNRMAGDRAWSPSFRNMEEVVLIRKFLDLDKVNESLGTVVIHIDSDYFRSLRSDSSLIQRGQIAILSDRGEMLVRGENPLADEIGKSLLNGISEKAATSRIESTGNGDVLITEERTSLLGWRIFCFIPLTKLMATKRILVLVIGLVSLVSIIISTGIAFLLSNSTAKNIKILEQTMRKVEEGNFDVRVAPLGRDEVGMLSVRFNYMVTRINDLINSVYKERLAKQQAEFSVLLAQINPHFLYNTLGTIKFYSRMKKQPDIEQMVTSLIGLLKSSVRRDGDFHTLDKEIDNISNYIHLQKIGYGDAFEVKYEIDKSLLSCFVPFLTLQPLVENAILHGLEISKSNGLIVIRVWQENNDVVLAVEDNGIGMDEAKIEDILHNADRPKTLHGLNSIGVRSIHERIRLYFGGKSGLSYESVPGKGTKAIIRLPYLTDREKVREYVPGYARE